MANPLTSIGAALFTDLSVNTGPVMWGKAEATADMPDTYTADGFHALFKTAISVRTYAKLKNVREFPAVGTPANIVNVPVYGQKISQSIGGQADAPTLEVTINYVGSDWEATSPITKAAAAAVSGTTATFSDVTGLRVGMFVRKSDATGSATNFITGISGNTITVNTTFTAPASSLITFTTFSDALPEHSLPMMVGDGVSRIWRFALMNSDTVVTETGILSKYDSTTDGIGAVGNAVYYFIGKMESLLVTPSLTDATTAKISISLQSPFYGAYSL